MAGTASGGIAGRLAAWAGALCAVHCVLAALGLGLLSVAGLRFLNDPWIEAAFLVVAIVAGAWAIVHGARRHGSLRPAALFVLGLTAIVAAHFVAESGVPAVRPAVIALAAFGGVLVTAFQFVNLRAGRCGCAHASSAPREQEDASVPAAKAS
jgi:hypothetical protein